MSVVICAAKPKDAFGVSAILSDWVDETPWMPRIHPSEEDQGFGKWLIEIMDVQVAKTSHDVLGFLARRDSEIHALYVAASARQSGIGAQLLQTAKLEVARLTLWTFQANKAARRFYLLNGFVESQLTDGQNNDEKLPDVQMIWESTANG